MTTTLTHATEMKSGFFLMRNGTVCRVFPSYQHNPDGEVEEVVVMPSNPKIYHKSRTLKVMLSAVTVQPRAEYDFDGKNGIWPFTIMWKALRSHPATGNIAGVTDILNCHRHSR